MKKYVKSRDLFMKSRAILNAGYRITSIVKNGKLAQGGELIISFE